MEQSRKVGWPGVLGAACGYWLMLASVTARGDFWSQEKLEHPHPCLRLWRRSQLHGKRTGIIGHLLSARLLNRHLTEKSSSGRGH